MCTGNNSIRPYKLHIYRRHDISFKMEVKTMRIAKEDIPVRIDVPGATARQITDFGDATGYGKIGGEYFSLGAGTDLAPYFMASRAIFVNLHTGVILLKEN